MMNYLKFQFNYLFSKIFVLCFLGIVIGTFLGIIISSNIDLGYNFLDGFTNDYAFDYSFQSLLIIEIVSVVISVFAAGVIGSKSNDYLICYSCNSYFERIIYFFSRMVVLIIFSFIYIIMVGLFMLLFTKYLTPYHLNEILLVNGLFAIFFISIYFSIFTMLLLSVVNHFIIVSLPFLIFWYIKTIYDFADFKTDVQEVFIRFFPSFVIKNEIIYYQETYIYIVIFISMLALSTVLSTIKDY